MKLLTVLIIFGSVLSKHAVAISSRNHHVQQKERERESAPSYYLSWLSRVKSGLDQDKNDDNGDAESKIISPKTIRSKWFFGIWNRPQTGSTSTASPGGQSNTNPSANTSTNPSANTATNPIANTNSNTNNNNNNNNNNVNTQGSRANNTETRSVDKGGKHHVHKEKDCEHDTRNRGRSAHQEKN